VDHHASGDHVLAQIAQGSLQLPTALEEEVDLPAEGIDTPLETRVSQIGDRATKSVIFLDKRLIAREKSRDIPPNPVLSRFPNSDVLGHSRRIRLGVNVGRERD
jgi:hypothetical protein